MLSLFLLALILMGAFVTVYNYVSYKLEAPPYLLSQTAIALIFLAYLSGTFTSTAAGRLVARWGAMRTTTLGIAVMLLGLGLTVLEPFGWVLTGIVLLTMGFFAAHSVASGWTGQLAGDARAQGTALYNVFYYLGSALVGWLGGFFYEAGGWPLTGSFCAVLVVAGSLVALPVLRRRSGERHG